MSQPSSVMDTREVFKDIHNKIIKIVELDEQVSMSTYHYSSKTALYE
jgi:hypothetical protein